jgi:hypothetical protein
MSFLPVVVLLTCIPGQDISQDRPLEKPIVAEDETLRKLRRFLVLYARLAGNDRECAEKFRVIRQRIASDYPQTPLGRFLRLTALP